MSRHWILALLIFVFSAWSPTPTFPQSSPREAANYTACLYGNSFGCNPSLLTDVQRSQVQRAALQRNYTACVYGNDFGCNKSLLTTTQQADVQRAVTSPGASAEVWEKVIARLRAGSMPPPGRPRPDKATYHAVASALEDTSTGRGPPIRIPAGSTRSIASIAPNTTTRFATCSRSTSM